MTPYEQGAADCNNRLLNRNPFSPFTERWRQYNRGFNYTAGWPSGKQATTMSEWREDEPVHGCGHMQGRGAA